jgi:hypothetical protein
MDHKKLVSILQLDAAARYAYFVRKVADTQAIWGLEQSAWASAANDEGSMPFPFWPEKEFADLCATGSWEGYAARAIDLRDFLGKWLHGMTRDGVKPVIFPTPENRGVVVSAEKLQEAIEAENAQYE